MTSIISFSVLDLSNFVDFGLVYLLQQRFSVKLISGTFCVTSLLPRRDNQTGLPVNECPMFEPLYDTTDVKFTFSSDGFAEVRSGWIEDTLLLTIKFKFVNLETQESPIKCNNNIVMLIDAYV